MAPGSIWQNPNSPSSLPSASIGASQTTKPSSARSAPGSDTATSATPRPTGASPRTTPASSSSTYTRALDESAETSRRSFPLSTCATHCSSLIRSSWMGVLLGTGDAQEVEGFFLDVCRPCGDCEGEVGREGGRDGVFGDGGEVVKQGVEAVDGETIVGSACGLLGEGGGRSLSLCDRALAERLGGLLVGVVVEHEGQALAHVPFEIIGEHAEEDVGAHAVFEPVVDRPDMEVDGLDRPDGVLDQA